jgi:thiamine-phosphate pyrophosphorylase
VTVRVNGRDRDLAPGTTVEALIRDHGLQPRYVVVERNGEPLPRDTYATTVLAEGDRLELVRAVAGGQGRDGAWRRRRLANCRLYCCLGRRADHDDLERFLDVVLGAGVDLVQLRDKHAGPAQLRAAAAVFRAAAAAHDALFVVNDDPALAAEVDADGVHVGQDDAPPAQARRRVGEDRLVGRSTHTVAEVDAALREDCDYFAIGPVHATPTKAGRPAIGLDPVRHAARVAPRGGSAPREVGERPWFVTGGMAADTAPDVVAAGARRMVVVRAFTDAPDPAAAVRRLRAILDSA